MTHVAILRANSKSPLQRSLSAKYLEDDGYPPVWLRKGQLAEDDEKDEDTDVTEEEY